MKDKRTYSRPETEIIVFALELATLIPTSLVGAEDRAGADFRLDEDDDYDL